jgi:hypothetical protein
VESRRAHKQAPRPTDAGAGREERRSPHVCLRVLSCVAFARGVSPGFAEAPRSVSKFRLGAREREARSATTTREGRASMRLGQRRVSRRKHPTPLMWRCRTAPTGAAGPLPGATGSTGAPTRPMASARRPSPAGPAAAPSTTSSKTLSRKASGFTNLMRSTALIRSCAGEARRETHRTGCGLGLDNALMLILSTASYRLPRSAPARTRIRVHAHTRAIRVHASGRGKCWPRARRPRVRRGAARPALRLSGLSRSGGARQISRDGAGRMPR